MKKNFILIFLLLVVNSISVVYSQSSDNQTCSGENSPCVKLNGLLSSCGGAISPPPDNVPAYEYDVENKNLAPCMCNQVAYDTLSSCVTTCFSNGNSNIKAVSFVNYQKSCKKFDNSFGPPIKDTSSSDTAGVAKKALIFVFSAISLLILGGLLFWYWYKKRSKRLFKSNEKPSFEEDDVPVEPPREQMMVHHPSPGSGISVSSIENNTKPKYYPPPPDRTGLFPPPGTIQSHPPQPQHSGDPYYNSPHYDNPPPASQQGYFPPQPLQPPQPPQPPQPLQPPQPPYPPFQSPAQMYPRPPPIRNPYQQSQRPHFRNSPNNDYRPPPPPNDYYNPSNYYH